MAGAIYKDNELNEITQYGLMKTMFESRDPLKALLLKSDGSESKIHFPGILYTDGGGPTQQAPAISPGQFINYLLGRTYPQDINLVTHKEISSLVSYIKILKIPRVGKDNKPVRPVSLGVKSGTEIPFRTYYKPIFDQNKILRDENGAGIVSLKVDVISNTGAYYKQQINLKLHFMNASMLGNDPNWKFVLTTPTVDDTGQDVVYGLIYGWASPDNIDEYEVRNAKTLYDMKTAIIMNLKKYEISFNQDGSVILSLDFIGSAELIAGDNKADIINNQKIRQQEEKYNAEIETERQKLEEKRKVALKSKQENESLAQFQKANPASMYGPGGGTAVMPSAEQQNRNIDEEYQKASQEYDNYIKEKQAQASEFKYSEFLTDLIDSRKVHTAKLSVPQERNSVVVEPIGTLGKFNNSGIGSQTENVDPVNAAWIGQGGAREQYRKAIRQAVAEEKQPLTDAESTALNAVASPVTQVAAGNYFEAYFTFVFAGDIVAKAVKTMYENTNLDQLDLKVLMTTTDVVKVGAKKEKDPKSGNISLKIDDDEEGTQYIIDLATFPIAYNLFSAWFIKNVVSPKRQQYLFKDFIKDFFNQVVLTSIENYAEWSRKFTPESPNFVAYRKYKDENIELSFVDVPYDLTRSPYSTNGQKVSQHEIRNAFKANKLVEVNERSGPTTGFGQFAAFMHNENQNVEFHRYAFIYGSLGKVRLSGDASNGSVSPQRHSEEGIFQFYVGAATGILKEIKFQPISSPERLSAQVLNATNDVQGKPSNKTFNAVQRYDVNISCVGFHYFQPGQLIFIDTQLLGFGHPTDEPKSVARLFTLGGYYLITKVSHDIEQSQFSTSLVAKFVDWGERRKGSKSGAATP